MYKMKRNSLFIFIFTVLSLLRFSLAFEDGELWVVNDINNLEFDANNRLDAHWLLFSDNARCREEFSAAWGERNFENDKRYIAPMSAEIDMKFFGKTAADESCRAVCLEKGTLDTHLFHPLSNALFEGEEKMEKTLAEWIQDTCQFIELGFVSYNANDIIVNWINHKGKPMQVGVLKRGEKNTMWQLTTLGHKFELVDSVTKAVLGRYVASQQGQVVIGNPGSGVDKTLDKTGKS
jgi:hypothetical protein